MCTPRWSGSRSTEQEISAKTSFSCPPAAEPDRLVDAADARAREADPNLRRGRLEIVREGRCAPSMLRTVPGGIQVTDDTTSRSSSAWRATTCARRSRPSTGSRGRSPGRTGSTRRWPSYSEMIEPSSEQLTELLDELSLAARIEGGRYDPKIDAVSTGRARGCGRRPPRRGTGRSLRRWRRRSRSDARRGEAVDLGARPVRAPPRRSRSGRAWSPTDRAPGLPDHAGLGAGRPRPGPARPGAAVAVRHVEWLGGSVAVDGETLTIRLA